MCVWVATTMTPPVKKDRVVCGYTITHTQMERLAEYLTLNLRDGKTYTKQELSSFLGDGKHVFNMATRIYNNIKRVDSPDVKKPYSAVVGSPDIHREKPKTDDKETIKKLKEKVHVLERMVGERDQEIARVVSHNEDLRRIPHKVQLLIPRP